MIYGITYSDDKMMRSAALCVGSMAKHGVDYPYQKTFADIEDDFWRMNKDIFNQNRGGGYWLWKPYFIYNMMIGSGIQDGDILIYADAGIEFVESVHHIIDRMDENVFLFTNTHPNHHWTKRYALDQIMPTWDKLFKQDTPWPQVQASVIFFRVCGETKDLVKKWLLWCQMPGIIDDSKGPCDEYPFFQDHRHDQSVITTLATFAFYKLHWWPTAYAEHIRVPGDNYPVLFNHHRKRDPGKGNGEPEWPQT